ncbi:MAG: tRNA uridine(34) 5-carboxymethylaminomethyl modification radical SAM/GNAT enzyme Elp3 [Thermoplasmata archaeon]|nr:tRNA uridine(34) 5-carboxymethylaminomethyl modification radical SAM/GNAT enzyme Elp3 [Thermoplasmata archaeon]
MLSEKPRGGFWEELVEALIKEQPKSREELERIKREIAGRHSRSPPRSSDILRHLPENLREEFLPILRKKPTRTLSGVAVVAAMTSPAPCPHGRCIYCPGGVGIWTPQSYTGREPAAMRASQNSYDPYLQVKVRLKALEEIGHPTGKIDFIIMGGTVTSRSLRYQRWFVKRALDAFNGETSITLREAQERNERAEHRVIGITFETRPDWATLKQTEEMLLMGATRVELGVQSISDEVLKRVRRGHGVKESAEATKLLKDAGLKVCYHMMPGLPGQSPKEAAEELKRLFKDERFMPDMLKIYPTLVVEGAPLFEIWRRGRYTPLDDRAAAEVVAEAKSHFPPWVRVQRVQRDIPSHLITAGVKSSNLRQLVHRVLEERGVRCRCIRCREVGLASRKRRVEGELVLMRREYWASGGREVFLSFEYPEEDLIAGYLRLRLPSSAP